MASPGGTSLDEAQPLPERVGRVLLNGLFGLGLIAREDRGRGSSSSFHPATSMDAFVFAAAVAIEAGQMMAFPFAPVHDVWADSLFGNVVKPISSVIMPASADVWLGQLTYRVSLVPRLPGFGGAATHPEAWGQRFCPSACERFCTKVRPCTCRPSAARRGAVLLSRGLFFARCRFRVPAKRPSSDFCPSYTMLAVCVVNACVSALCPAAPVRNVHRLGAVVHHSLLVHCGGFRHGAQAI